MLILLINFVISVMSRRRWSCRAASIRQLIGAMKRQPGAGALPLPKGLKRGAQAPQIDPSV